MGPSGCGKTTLLNVLGLLDMPTSGKYHFDGQDVTHYSERKRAQLRKSKIGFIFQSFNLIDELTVYENVELPLIYQKISGQERRLRVEATLEKLEIAHRNSRQLIQLVNDLLDVSRIEAGKAMLEKGYWNDQRTIEALLAHEHAHPLAENVTTEASRCLLINFEVSRIQPPNLYPILKGLAEDLCILAPREIFTNQFAIENGFSEEIFYLNAQIFENAVKGVLSRDLFLKKIHQEVRSRKLSRKEADLLVIGGDLSAHLPLAMEIAPFYRSGFTTQAQKLERILDKQVFPKLDPIASPIFKSIQDEYLSLQDNSQELTGWAERVLNPLVEGLSKKGLTLNYRIQMAKPQACSEGRNAFT